MSTALAIAGVTAILRDRLNDGLINNKVAGQLGKSVTVSVCAPDRVVPVDGTETSQLNLFLYQVLPNASWRNECLPSYDSSGQQRLGNPPLALDLYYLISAYSGGDFHAEILLGYAMQLMHEFPVITRAMLHTALTPSPDLGVTLPAALRALADCGLADQVEQLRITPQTLNSEEISKLWAATQSSLRPTAAYQVSVVLIEATRPAVSPLPVLSRGEVDPVFHRERGVMVSAGLIPAIPTLEAIVPEGQQPVVQLDRLITLQGHHLDGSKREIRLGNPRYDVNETLAASGANLGASMELVIPESRAAEFPVGVYEAFGRVVPPGESNVRETNHLGFTLAPNITNLPQSIARNGDGNVLVTITFTPQLRPGQRATLLLGQQEIVPKSIAAPTASLDFLVVAPDIGDYPVRLRIDGIDSPIVDRSATPATFLDRKLTIT
ncbi:DUF4255 domain-containing protein [Pseudomonas putida]